MFSIIMPVYNSERYIKEAIESVLNQNFNDFELIVIDDGSRDKSLDIINTLASHDSRIKVLINQEQKGVSFSRNRGLRYCSNSYVLFLDSDDLLPHYALKTYYTVIKKTNADIVFSKLSTNMNKIRAEVQPKIHIQLFNQYKAIKYYLNFRKLSGYAGAKVYRKEILSNTFFMENVNYGEDGIFNYAALQNAQIIAYIDLDTYIYRVRNGSLTGRNSGYGIKNLNSFKQIDFISKRTPKILKKYVNVFRFEIYNSEIQIYEESGKDSKIKFSKEFKKMKKYCDSYWLYTFLVSINPRIKLHALKYFVGRN